MVSANKRICGLDMDDDPPSFVSLALCIQKHKSLSKEIGTMSNEIHTIKRALIGEDLTSGLVKDIQELKSKMKGSWTGRDKALMLIALVEGIVAISIAFYK